MSSPCVISFFFIFFSSVKRIIEFFVYWTFWLWFRMYLRKGTSVLRLSDWWSHRDARDLFKWKEEWILFLLMLIGQYTFMNHKRTKCPRLYKYLAKVSIDGTLRMLWGQGELRSWEERPAKCNLSCTIPLLTVPGEELEEDSKTLWTSWKDIHVWDQYQRFLLGGSQGELSLSA